MKPLAELLSVPTEVIAQAKHNLSTGNATFLLVSGKMASGKDTLAPEILKRAGFNDTVHIIYADALKDQADELLAEIRTAETPAAAVDTLCYQYDIPVEWAADMVDSVWDESRSDRTLHARSRTPEIRRLLQVLGTDVRREQDPDYWVKIALRHAVNALAQGKSVFVTDARFPNEVDMAREMGAYTVRLLVTPETQMQRIRERDGLTPDADSLRHPSELALDQHVGFSLTLDNNGTVEEALVAIDKVFPRRAVEPQMA